jgi:molybdopterin/thiamine biosynthesis adenylyltransferase/proteasome lid subunit RPN8/RPN11
MHVTVPKITIADNVYAEIQQTIGSLPAETGGVLGGNPRTGKVTQFFHDARARSSAVEYQVEASRLNPVIEDWNRHDIHLMGMIHSHPPGHETPSGLDVEFARRILNRPDNDALPHFLIPIVQSGADTVFSLRVFTVLREAFSACFELPYTIAPTAPLFPVVDPLYARIFTRVRTAHDLHRLHGSLVVGVGCGGGTEFIENLARAGVGHFLLLDPDTFSEQNIATQACDLRDVGRFKVEALKERLLRINPFAKVETVPAPLDSLSDDDVRTLLFSDEQIATRLLCGLSDDFWAQWRVNLLALTMGAPALFAQVYRRGAAAEIVFTHPDTTRQCARCILSGRFKAYLNNRFQNDASSDGAQYYATPRLNATKFLVAMAMLHHGSDHPYWGSMLLRIGQRNCVQIRCDPDVAMTLKLPNFDQAFAGAAPGQTFMDETIWRQQHPENRTSGYAHDCPDCGGTGNLLDSVGRFADTRAFVRKAKRNSTFTLHSCENS